jgi:pilus assembly protein CpaB
MLIRNILLAAGIFAIVLGIGLAVFLLVRPGGAQKAVLAGSELSVLAAARPIRPGDTLVEGDIAWRTIDAKTKPTGSLAKGQVSPLELVGAVARTAYAPGDLIKTGGYYAATDRHFLAAALAPGYRAVTIAVVPAQVAAGLMLPDDRVDVIIVRGSTSSSGAGADGGAFAQTLLRNVRILALGREFDRPSGPPSPTGGGQAADTVTLELSPLDAERLYAVLEVGKVELSLRSLAHRAASGEESPITAGDDEGPVWASDLLRGRGPAHGAAATIRSRAASAPGDFAGRAASDVPIRIIRATGASTP